MLIKPSLSSIWLAEDAVFDEQTGQTTLTSVFNQISLSAEGSEYVNRLPVFQPGAYVWELSLNEETLGSTRMTAVREL